jgi:hypothetical protein
MNDQALREGGSLFEDENGILSGYFVLDGIQYHVAVTKNAYTSDREGASGREYHRAYFKTDPKAKESVFSGFLFKNTDKEKIHGSNMFWINFRRPGTENDENAKSLQVTGFYVTQKKDGSPAKSPFYNLTAAQVQGEYEKKDSPF